MKRRVFVSDPFPPLSASVTLEMNTVGGREGGGKKSTPMYGKKRGRGKSGDLEAASAPNCTTPI